MELPFYCKKDDFKLPNSFDEIADKIGDTPLVKIESLSRQTGRNIYAKLEYHNPGRSIKDRAALGMILDAESRGVLVPGQGGTIVEATAGNTGLGLLTIGKAKGYDVVLIVPENQSAEKIETLRELGAQVIVSPLVPPSSPLFFEKLAAMVAREMGGVLIDQKNNPANKMAHYNSTAPEIVGQLGKFPDGFICAAGSGGTFAGVSKYFKEHSPSTQCALPDKYGSVLTPYFFSRTYETEPHKTLLEGVGMPEVKGNLLSEFGNIDNVFRISDIDAIKMVYKVLDEEGLGIGGTSGMNLCGAVKLAESLPEGSDVVTIVADSSNKYATKFFSKKWLKMNAVWDHLDPQLRDKYAILD